MIEKFGVESPGLKLLVEKSNVEMYFNHFEGFAASESNRYTKNQVLQLIFIKLKPSQAQKSMIKLGLLTPQNLYSTMEAQWEMFYCFPSLISSHFISWSKSNKINGPHHSFMWDLGILCEILFQFMWLTYFSTYGKKVSSNSCSF